MIFQGSSWECDSCVLLETDLQDDEDSDQGLIMRGSSPVNVGPVVPSDSSTYFRDGRRKIDFVLVYEETTRSGGRSSSISSAIHEVGGDKKRSTKLEAWRQRFMTNLRKTGLDMEEEVIESSNKKLVYFIKLHATWPVLCHYAEELNMRAPLQAHPNPSVNWSHLLLKTLHLPNIMYEEVPNKPLDYYTCPFRKSKLDRLVITLLCINIMSSIS